MEAKDKKHIIGGMNVKTINGKYGSFQILKVDVEAFNEWVNTNNKGRYLTIAIYPRKDPDMFNNTHTPTFFVDTK